MTIILGIDPGASGGLAWLRTEPQSSGDRIRRAVEGGGFLPDPSDMTDMRPKAMKMPETEADTYEAIARIERGRGRPGFAIIEQLGPLPSFKKPDDNDDAEQGAMRGSIASFKVGRSYGTLRGFLIASGIPFEEALPRKWQAAMGCPRLKGEPRTRFKNRLKARAQQLFPGLKITLATADALLLAEYGRRLWLQRNGKVVLEPADLSAPGIIRLPDLPF